MIACFGRVFLPERRGPGRALVLIMPGKLKEEWLGDPFLEPVTLSHLARSFVGRVALIAELRPWRMSSPLA
jgi:hypothetical protein